MKLFFLARILHEIFPISRFKFLIMNVFLQSSFDILSITIIWLFRTDVLYFFYDITKVIKWILKNYPES